MILDTSYKVFISEARLSFVDYPSLQDSCLTYFFKGCEHHCPGCHNERLMAYNASDTACDGFTKYECGDICVPDSDYMTGLGSKIDAAYTDVRRFCYQILKDIELKNRGKPYVCLQGGDPLAPFNRKFLQFVIHEIATNIKLKDSIKLCVYTGYDSFNILPFMIDLGSNIHIRADNADIGHVLPWIKVGKYDNTNLNPSEDLGKKNGKMTFASKNQRLLKYDSVTSLYTEVSVGGIYTF